MNKNLILKITLCTLLICYLPSIALSGNPLNTFSFQGRLEDSDGIPISSTINMTFRIYDKQNNSLWNETKSISIVAGEFDVILGESSPIGFSVNEQAKTLGISIGSEDEMEPRQQIGGSLRAGFALSITDAAITTSKLADSAVTSEKLADNALTSIKIADNAIESSKLSGSGGLALTSGTDGQVLISNGNGSFRWGDADQENVANPNSGVTQELFSNIPNNGTVQVTARTVTIEEKVTSTNNVTTDIISDSDSSKWDYEDAKGSITQFVVDTANTSGHFENSSNNSVTLGAGNTETRVIEKVNFKLSGDSEIYAINSIINNGNADNEVIFSLRSGSTASKGTGIYSIEWIRGVNMQNDIIRLSSDGSSSDNDNQTVLLIQSDTTDGSTTFTDLSLGGTTHTITTTGDVHHETTNALSDFGNTSIYFDGSGDWLTIDASSDFVFGTEDFAVDLWFKLNNLTNRVSIICNMSTTSTKRWTVQYGKYNGQLLLYFNGVENNVSFSSTNWHHLAFARSSGVLRFYLDGVKIKEVIANSDIGLEDVIEIGGTNYGGLYLTGYIDEVRISKGTDRGWNGENITVPTLKYSSSSSIVNKFYTAITNDTGRFNSTNWIHLNSGTATESLNGQKACYSVSFDNRRTFQIFDVSEGSWRNIIKDNSGTWQYNNAASGSESWTNATINEMAAAISEAIELEANQMTGGQLSSITGGQGSQWENGWGDASYIDVAITLKIISSTVSPSVSAITFNYDELFTRIAALTDGVASGTFTAQANDFTIGTRTWTIKNVSGEIKSFIVNKF